MADQWYYWHDAAILGPFTGKELFDLAASGNILTTDTVWKDGVEAGVQASQVNHLFVPVLLALPRDPVTNTTETQSDGTSKTAAAIPVASEPKADAPRWDVGSQKRGGKSRAVAGKGAVLVGQDGVNVKFLMKCTTCGYQASTWKTMPITRGTTKVVFYCQKCRKQRHAEFTGYVG
jgi:hypothetical protein